jgi:hypothetical protein
MSIFTRTSLDFVITFFRDFSDNALTRLPETIFANSSMLRFAFDFDNVLLWCIAQPYAAQ